MLLPKEDEYLRQAGIPRDTVEAFSFLLQNRPVCVAKAAQAEYSDQARHSLIRWVATDGALKRGTVVRAVVWGEFSVPVAGWTFSIETLPDTPGGVTGPATLIDTSSTWLIDVWWRLSGEATDPQSSPNRSSILRVDSITRMTYGDGFGLPAGKDGMLGYMQMTNVAPPVLIGPDNPVAFEVKAGPRSDPPDYFRVLGGFMEVI